MKRKFVYQSETSNKYWNISIEAHLQIINFGKLGTKGRETVKDFGNRENCLHHSNKLIQQKLKKGYTEILTPKETALNKTVLEDKDGSHLFWEVIATSNRSVSSQWKDYHIQEHIDNISILLSFLDKEKIILFEKVLQEKLHELHLASIAELYIILNCPFEKQKNPIIFDDFLSTDGFIYFRCWLLLKGKDFFTEITQNINAFINGSYSFNIGDTWAEGLLYAADAGYLYYHEVDSYSPIRDAIRKLHPKVIHYDNPKKNTFDRVVLGKEKLQEQYPTLVAEICTLRS